MAVLDGIHEIAGIGGTQHLHIGQARSMPVPAGASQASVALAALQHHDAEVRADVSFWQCNMYGRRGAPPMPQMQVAAADAHAQRSHG